MLVPNQDRIRAGLADAEDPAGSLAVAEAATGRLADLVRAAASTLIRFEHVHTQYRHGMKLAARPFGEPTAEAIAERRASTGAPVITWTNEGPQEMAGRQAQAMAFHASPSARAHLSALFEQRALLHLRMEADVNFDDLVGQSWAVVRLQRILRHNRITLADGPDSEGCQTFALPGAGDAEQVDLTLALDPPARVEDFV
jgi:hypothetical protein